MPTSTPTNWRGRGIIERLSPRHCERSEAIHLAARRMDCFVANAPRNDGEFATAVMAGLVPAIHVFLAAPKNVNARDKPGHDGVFDALTALSTVT